jgi:hypothetical protein
LDILRRAIADGVLTAEQLAAVLVRVSKLVTAGASQQDAVRVILSARFDVDPSSARGNDVAGSHTLVSLSQGTRPIALCRPINNDGPDVKVGVDAGALESWDLFRRTINLNSGGIVSLVRPDKTAAATIPGLPSKFISDDAAPNPADAKLKNKPDGTVTAEMAATEMAYADRRYRDLLSRTTAGRAVLESNPYVGHMSADEYAEMYARDAMFRQDPEKWYQHIQFTVQEQRRRRLLSATPTGRAVLTVEDRGY